MKTILKLILISLTLCCVNKVSAQWMQQSNPTGNSLTDIYFINSITGWAISDIDVIKTTNSGNNWTSTGLFSSDNLSSICFTDANTGFLCGEKIYRTTNGGGNWQQYPDFGDSYYFKVFFANSSTGWIAGSSGNVYKTINAGVHWESVSNLGTILRSLSFINTNTGWVSGNNGYIAKTTNGGSSWTQQASGFSSFLHCIDFSDANNGRVSGQNVFLATTNGGTNWISYQIPFTNINAGYPKVKFMNSSTGWITCYAGGSGYAVAFTTNNGANWANLSPPDDGGGFDGLFFVSPSTVYAASSRIYKSTTGGFNLTAASNLTATTVSSSQINLNWTDNSGDEDKFMIERRFRLGAWTLIDSVNANVTSYQSTGLLSNDFYFFRVYPKKLVFTGSTSNEQMAYTLISTPANSSPANDTTIYSTTPTLSWSSVSGAIWYSCDVATDNSFTNIIYTTGIQTSTSAAVPSNTLQEGTKYYWRVQATNLNTHSNYSDTWSFTILNANYGNNAQTGNNLYYFANSTPGARGSPSQPTFNWRDTTGSTDLILNKNLILPLSAGSIDNGRFDMNGKLPVGNSIRFFGTNYQNFYIGTNGIIAFTSFSPDDNANKIEPTTGLPEGFITNAIFPLWINLDFSNTLVPVNRLCYKVTTNEVIITYSRAPIKLSGTNDYITFQVVIAHSPSPVSNSNICVQYNYDLTGSQFITKYNNGTVRRHLIGLQGANSSSEFLQYRYSNINLELISPGPIFGSNLALSFGPDANALPVELASFTSSVNGSKVKLEWSTVNELNNSGFEVQRTNANENNWKKISFVQGNGTTNESKNYSYEDKNLASGKYQYRLKQVDFNGNYEYFQLSNEVEIGVPKKFNLLQNYPNPFNPTTIINYQLAINSFVKIKIYDLSGREVKQLVNEMKEAGYYSIEFNGGNLASGMYFYRIQAGDFSAVKKMVLVK